jgi:hypothetical protein
MIERIATHGGWTAESLSDETILSRADDRAVVHVWLVVTNVAHDIERFRGSLEGQHTSGVVVIPGTAHNRRRVSEIREDLRDAFPARSNSWYAALVNPHRPMPDKAGILWAFPDASRLRPASILPGWIWTRVGDGPRFATGRRWRR